MCAVSNNGVWNYIDDLKDEILAYDNLNKLYEDQQSGWFFCFYVMYSSNNEILCENTTYNAPDIYFEIVGSRKRKRKTFEVVKEYPLRSKYNKSSDNRKYHEKRKDILKNNRKEYYEMHKDRIKDY